MGVLDLQVSDLDALGQSNEDVVEQMERLLDEQKETGTIGDDDGSPGHALADTATTPDGRRWTSASARLTPRWPLPRGERHL